MENAIFGAEVTAGDEQISLDEGPAILHLVGVAPWTMQLEAGESVD